MKKDLVELVFILDKSGSMGGLEKDTIGGYNSLIRKQRKGKGEALVTTVLFSNNLKVISDRKDIKNVEELTDKEYCPSGCTALLDAVGETINHIMHVQSQLSDFEKPEKTIVIITTDGLENASREYNYAKVKELISLTKEKYNWEFLFLGANIDVNKEVDKMGIDPAFAVKYECNEEGIDANFCCLSNTISKARTTKKISKSWKKDLLKEEK